MIDLTIKSLQPETRQFELEAPDGFVVRILDPLPRHMEVGEKFAKLWQQWKDDWAKGTSPCVSRVVWNGGCEKAFIHQ